VADVRVSRRGAARIAAGHPWVFRADLVGDATDTADEVRVCDERGRPLAAALAAAAPAPIALRVYARGAFRPFAEVLPERLDRAIGRRSGATVCRLVHAEADEIPGLFVDRYGDAAVVQAATAAIDRREGAIAAMLAERLGLRLVVRRDDGSLRDHEGLAREKGVLLGGGPVGVAYVEGPARFTLDLIDDAKTGGFLDQRENHARAAALAAGDALDAFTYHGGFALAMAPRAARVVALDADPRAAERARANAAASGLANVDVRHADAFVELRAFERDGRRFRMVVLDPPALAKGRRDLDAALRAYKEINLRAMRIVEPDGWLVSCSCSGRVTPAAFEAMLADAARDAGRAVTLVERRGAAADHPVLLGVPETEYLKCYILRIL
jgi:23S rRNA (cytosine1962-C5)-methyltransferase